MTGTVLFGTIKMTMGLRVTAEEEIEGLDIGEHGSEAYPDFRTAVHSYGSEDTSPDGASAAAGEAASHHAETPVTVSVS